MISTLDTLALLECLKSYHLSDAEIMEATGVSSTLLSTPDFEIPLENLIRLWKKTAEVTGDSAIGIHLRQHYGSHYVHFVNHIGINSRDLAEALQYYTRYGKLLCSAFSYELRQENDRFAFSFSINSPSHQNPWIPEYHLSLILYFASMLGIQGLTLEEVRFRHSCSGNPQIYSDFFGAPVFFDQYENAIIISDELMNIEIPGYDSHLQTVLKKQADDILEKLPQVNELLGRIEKVILKNLGSGMLDIEMVAQELGMHRSTLHRRLRENGCSFSELLTTIRKNLAECYLEQGMNINQISFLLGYSNRSNFQVAFKSWFGRSPGVFKKR